MGWERKTVRFFWLRIESIPAANDEKISEEDETDDGEETLGGLRREREREREDFCGEESGLLRKKACGASLLRFFVIKKQTQKK